MDPLASEYMTATQQEREALAYVARLCGKNHISCDSPEFKALKAELMESALSLSEVDKQLALFGSDLRLLRARERIEIHQGRIIKAMVKTL